MRIEGLTVARAQVLEVSAHGVYAQTCERKKLSVVASPHLVDVYYGALFPGSYLKFLAPFFGESTILVALYVEQNTVLTEVGYPTGDVGNQRNIFYEMVAGEDIVKTNKALNQRSIAAVTYRVMKD